MTLLFSVLHSVDAQNDIECDAIGDFLSKMENRVKKLNIEDPELIPLHYLLALDIEKELNNFSQKIIPQLSVCKELNYYKTVTRFDDIAFKHSIKKLKLATLSKQVDSIFLHKAIRELHHDNRANAYFFLDKSLQFNPIYPDALLLKIRLLFEEDDYQECLTLLQTLYYEAPLQRKHEIEISDFNMLFYNRLYHTADSLVKMEKAADALELFKTLETFCTDMPVEYCNDDYYHGILRSREGVYESYIIIAKVAAEKGNKEIERKFLEYAEEYRIANHNELPSSVSISLPFQMINLNIVETKPEITEKLHLQKPEKEEITEFIPSPPPTNPEIIAQNYNQLLIESMTLTLDGKFKKAYETIKEALELENCNCFPKDERVQMLYNVLNKAYFK